MSDSTDLIAPPEEPAAVEPAEAVGASEANGEPEAEAKSDAVVEAQGEAETTGDAAVAEAKDEAEVQAASEPPADAAPAASPAPANAAVTALRKARDTHGNVEGRVFGWNPGGFHVVIDGLAAFVPRSEMELEPIADPEAYLDKTFAFRVLKIQGKGRRIVLSRTAILRAEQEKQTTATLSKLRANDVLKGKVASLTEFGAFVDIGGGIEGLVHVSEISRQRVAKPADALKVGQEVDVKVLKVEKGGKRVSLSMKALEPDPWREIREKYPEGAVVTGTVERTDKPGAFIQLEPGLVGLLPTAEMGLPREAIPARAYPKGKEVRVQVVGVDAKRRRISLAPEGSQIEGTRGDYQTYLKQQRREADTAGGFNALASALSKIRRDQPDR
ncbi:MAG TPA: S1 RNA-binding domain-containing protein [Thermoanaerobaculia bacterium]|nr:S1 RNA-binding domain-containing protein [Thermoanaerobaculia bacterium]